MENETITISKGQYDSLITVTKLYEAHIDTITELFKVEKKGRGEVLLKIDLESFKDFIVFDAMKYAEIPPGSNIQIKFV